MLIATVRTLLFARRAEELRRRSSERLGAMLRLAPIGVALMDAQLRYEEVNDAFCALLGCTPAELLGKVLGEAAESALGRLARRRANPAQGDRAVARRSAGRAP